MDLMSDRFGIRKRRAPNCTQKKGALIARFQAKWEPVGRPESALV
jgi:hypothetical protein